MSDGFSGFDTIKLGRLIPDYWGRWQMSKNEEASANEKIRDAIELLKEASKEKKIELLHLLSGIFDNIKEAEGKAVEKVKGAATKVDKSVHKNPWAYIGGAALAGVLVGFLLRFRRGR
jgi:ElaB/YqjD/DUF883 family membrane-anchored ribosome-binding protein